jgi:hypothetical protein
MIKTPTRSGCWLTLGGRCAERTSRPSGWSRDPGVGRRRGRLRRAVKDLAELLDLTHRIAAQTRQRLSGTIPDGPRRGVSPRDSDARPIAQGRRGKPVEFGYQPQGADNENGVVLDHSVHLGNPLDAPSSTGRRTRHRPHDTAARAP